MKLMKPFLISGALALPLLGSVDLSNINTQTVSAKKVAPIKLSKPKVKGNIEYRHARINGKTMCFGRTLIGTGELRIGKKTYPQYYKGYIYIINQKNKKLGATLTHGVAKGGQFIRTWKQMEKYRGDIWAGDLVF